MGRARGGIDRFTWGLAEMVIHLEDPKNHDHRPYGHGSKPMVPCWDRCTTHFRTSLGVRVFVPWPNK